MTRRYSGIILLASVLCAVFPALAQYWEFDREILTPGEDKEIWNLTVNDSGVIYAITQNPTNALYRAIPTDDTLKLVFDAIDDSVTLGGSAEVRGVAAYETLIYVSFENGTSSQLLEIDASAQVILKSSFLISGNSQVRITGIDIDAQGNLYAARSDKFVRVFSPYGYIIRDVAAPFAGGGGFVDDLALIPGGDYSQPTVPLYTSNRGAVASWVGGTNANPFNYAASSFATTGGGSPNGVACDSAGQVYVADTANNRVLVYTADGRIAHTIDMPDAQPSDVAVSPNRQELYVASLAEKKIYVYRWVPEWPINWKIAAGDVDWFDTNLGRVQGIAYNPKTRHMLVSSRNGDRVIILDAATGNELGDLDVTNVEGGSFGKELMDIEAAQDGAIYLCNFTSNSSVEPFKIYRWADENAVPTIAYAGSVGTVTSLGDVMTVIGSGTRTMIYVSGMRSSVIAQFTSQDGLHFQNSKMISVPFGSAGQGLSLVSPDGPMFTNAKNSPVRLIDLNGAAIGEISSAYLDWEAADAQYFQVRTMNNHATTVRKFLAATSGDIASAQVVDLGVNFPVGFPAKMRLLDGPTAAMGSNSNSLGTSDVVYDPKNHALIVMIANNGIASYSMYNLVVNPDTSDLPFPALTVTPDSADFEVTLPETDLATITVTNSGSADLFIDTITLTKSTVFSWSGMEVPTSLTPGTSRSLTVQFAPAQPGYFSATLGIYTNAGGQEIPLAGSAKLPFWEQNWQVNAAATTWFGTEDKVRGMALNPITGHLLIATRQVDPGAVVILNAETGDSLGALTMDGVSGGALPINKVGVSRDGTIYGCNLQADVSAGVLKIYSWNDESSAPTVAYEGNVSGAGRYGDAFSVVGSGLFTRILVSGLQNPNLALFTTTDGAAFGLDQTIEVGAGTADLGVSALRNNDLFFATGLSSPSQLFDYQGQQQGAVPTSVFPSQNTEIKFFEVTTTGGKERSFLATLNGSDHKVKVAELSANFRTNLSESVELVGPPSPVLGLTANPNRTGEIVYNPHAHSIIVLETNNSITSFSMYSVVVDPDTSVVPLTEFVVSPTELSFANYVGEQSRDTITVKNTGETKVVIDSVKVGDGQAFTVSDLATPLLLLAGDSIMFTVTFAPAASIEYTGQLSVYSTAGVGQVSLTGRGLPPFWPLNWQKRAEDTAWLGTDGKVRSIAHNVITRHLLIATREIDGGAVIVLDASTGDSLGVLSMDGVDGGELAINQIDVADDGAIYVCNQTDVEISPFKIYRWANESSTPVVAYDGSVNGTGRYGDAFDVIGSGLQTRIFASGLSNAHLAVFSTIDGLTFSNSKNISISAGEAGLGISVVSENDEMFIDGPDTPVKLIDGEGQEIGQIPTDIFSAEDAGVSYFEIYTLDSEIKNFVAARNSVSHRAHLAQLGTDFPDDFPNVVTTVGTTTRALGDIENPDQAGKVIYDSQNNAIVVLETNNSLTSFSMENVVANPDTSVRATPELVASPMDLEFTARLGEQQSRTVTLFNAGRVNVIIEDVSIIGDTVFQLSDFETPKTLLSGASVDVVIEFSPVDSIDYSASLMVQNNAGEKTIAMIGHGRPAFWSTRWFVDPHESPWLDGDDSVRGLAYNLISKHILVASQTTVNKEILVLDAQTGDSLSSMDCSTLSGGERDIYDLKVSDDGAIFVGNLTKDVTSAPFTLYRFASESAQPSVAYQGRLDGSGRYGDALSVAGKDGKMTVYVAGVGNSDIAVLTSSDGLNFAYSGVLPVPTMGRGASISVVSPGGQIFVNSSGYRPILIENDGTVVGELPEEIADSSSTEISYFKVWTTSPGSDSVRHFVAVANPSTARADLVELRSNFIQQFEGSYSKLGIGTPGQTSAANPNATGGLAYDPFNNALLFMATNSGLGSYSMRVPIPNPDPARTPKVPALTVSPSSLSFESRIDESSIKKVALISEGNANVMIETIALTITSSEGGPFTPSRPGFKVPVYSYPITIAPTDTFWLPVEFIPPDTVEYSGTLTLESNAGSGSVVLSGKGRPAFWTVNWLVGPEASWFGTNDENLGLTYNLKTRHLIVPSLGSDGDELIIIDALSGDSLRAIDCSGLTEGDEKIGQVISTSDGEVYLCNLTEDVLTTPFKLFRFADEAAEPTLAYEGQLNGVGRYGDVLGLIGRRRGTTIYVSGRNNEHIAVLKTIDGVEFSLASNIPVAPSAAHSGISPIESGVKLFVNGAGTPAKLIEGNGAIVGEIPEYYHSKQSSDIYYFEVHTAADTERFVAFTNGQTANARLFALGPNFVENWPSELAPVGPDTPLLGTNPNAGATGKVVYDPFQNTLIVLSTNNGLASINMGNVISEWDTTIVEVADAIKREIPDDYNLEQNFPNPFNPSTEIGFSLPEPGFVQLKLYDILGRTVRTLVSERKDAGAYTVVVRAADLSSGIYVYRLQVNKVILQRKMILVR